MAHGRSSQANKAHKPGRRAGPGAHVRSQQGRNPPKSINAAVHARKGKEARQQALAAARAKSRAASQMRKRHGQPPVVVQLLALSDAVDMQSIWDLIVSTSTIPPSRSTSMLGSTGPGGTEEMATDPQPQDLAPTTVQFPGKSKNQVTFLPPLPQQLRTNPLAIVDVAKAADVVLVCTAAQASGEQPSNGTKAHGGNDAELCSQIDSHGRMALQVLCAMGLPGVVLGMHGVGGGLKERAAGKKQLSALLGSHLGGEHKTVVLDTAADAMQLLRHLEDLRLELPVWRRHRPHLLIEAADASVKDPAAPASQTTQLRLWGHLRGAGLCAAQAVSLPIAGDRQIESIEILPPESVNGQAPAARTVGAGEGNDANVMRVATDVCDREELRRENDAQEDMEDEQTWPSAEELGTQRAGRAQRRLAPGTSDYQGCWILDDDEYEAADVLDAPDAPTLAAADGAADADAEAGDLGRREMERSGSDMESQWQEAGDEGGGGASEMDTEEGVYGAVSAADVARIREERRRQEADDMEFPDEVEVAQDVAARERFQKYRGLKSFRSSPWDPRENLPPHYSRLFAFDQYSTACRRAWRRADECTSGTVPHSVPLGHRVCVTLADVPAEAAKAVCERAAAYRLGHSPALSLFGLHRHECKLSVVNLAVQRHEGVEGEGGDTALRSKDEVVVVTGVRAFRTRPLLSTDAFHADKFKAERFMHARRGYVMSMLAPISFAPLPALVFKVEEGAARLVGKGRVQDANPDRVILKKIIFSGYPVKVHKHSAVVGYMFFNAEDVKWFRPLELWTKRGRRGRIKAPIGTHGAMKCVFDAPLQQSDSVCVSLYKRVFPKWPAQQDFNEGMF